MASSFRNIGSESSNHSLSDLELNHFSDQLTNRSSGTLIDANINSNDTKKDEAKTKKKYDSSFASSSRGRSSPIKSLAKSFSNNDLPLEGDECAQQQSSEFVKINQFLSRSSNNVDNAVDAVAIAIATNNAVAAAAAAASATKVNAAAAAAAVAIAVWDGGSSSEISSFRGKRNNNNKSNNNGTQSVEGKARIVLICEPGSHPFEMRTIWLAPNTDCKVGRLITKQKAAENNAIFDCKVLSRNHALFMYCSNEKFWLKDMNSSNGTFINDKKLENEPCELHYGDIVRFGVDVVEHTKNELHGCIKAFVELYLPDGSPVAIGSAAMGTGTTTGLGLGLGCGSGSGLGFESGSGSGSLLTKKPMEQSCSESNITFDDLNQLSEYMQETRERKQAFEIELQKAQQLLSSSSQETTERWESLFYKDQALQHIQLLEDKIRIFEKNMPEHTLKTEIAKLEQEKTIYQSKVKETIETVNTECNEVVQKLSKIETNLAASQENFKTLHDQNLLTEKALQDASERLRQIEADYKTCRVQSDEQKIQTQMEYEKRMNEFNEKIQKQNQQCILLRLQFEELLDKCSVSGVSGESGISGISDRSRFSAISGDDSQNRTATNNFDVNGNKKINEGKEKQKDPGLIKPPQWQQDIELDKKRSLMNIHKCGDIIHYGESNREVIDPIEKLQSLEKYLKDLKAELDEIDENLTNDGVVDDANADHKKLTTSTVIVSDNKTKISKLMLTYDSIMESFIQLKKISEISADVRTLQNQDICMDIEKAAQSYSHSEAVNGSASGSAVSADSGSFSREAEGSSNDIAHALQAKIRKLKSKLNQKDRDIKKNIDDLIVQRDSCKDKVTELLTVYDKLQKEDGAQPKQLKINNVAEVKNEKGIEILNAKLNASESEKAKIKAIEAKAGVNTEGSTDNGMCTDTDTGYGNDTDTGCANDNDEESADDFSSDSSSRSFDIMAEPILQTLAENSDDEIAEEKSINVKTSKKLSVACYNNNNNKNVEKIESFLASTSTGINDNGNGDTIRDTILDKMTETITQALADASSNTIDMECDGIAIKTEITTDGEDKRAKSPITEKLTNDLLMVKNNAEQREQQLIKCKEDIVELEKTNNQLRENVFVLKNHPKQINRIPIMILAIVVIVFAILGYFALNNL